MYVYKTQTIAKQLFTLKKTIKQLIKPCFLALQQAAFKAASLARPSRQAEEFPLISALSSWSAFFLADIGCWKPPLLKTAEEVQDGKEKKKKWLLKKLMLKSLATMLIRAVFFYSIKMRTKRTTESFSRGETISPKLTLIAVCALQLSTSGAAPHANTEPSAAAERLTPQARRAFPLGSTWFSARYIW